MDRITVRIPRGDLARLDAYAKGRGVTRSAALKELLGLGLQEAEHGVIDVRELIPELHVQINDLQKRLPKAGGAFRVLAVTALEAVMILRQVAGAQDKQLLATAQRNTKSAFDALEKEGTL